MKHDHETPGTIRKLWPSETKSFREHLLRLDSESRANRFGTPVTDYFIEQYSARAAEAAFSIEKPFQNNGVGSALMGRTILAARNRGVKKLFMNCLSHNHPMQA